VSFSFPSFLSFCFILLFSEFSTFLAVPSTLLTTTRHHSTLLLISSFILYSLFPCHATNLPPPPLHARPTSALPAITISCHVDPPVPPTKSIYHHQAGPSITALSLAKLWASITPNSGSPTWSYTHWYDSGYMLVPVLAGIYLSPLSDATVYRCHWWRTYARDGRIYGVRLDMTGQDSLLDRRIHVRMGMLDARWSRRERIFTLVLEWRAGSSGQGLREQRSRGCRRPGPDFEGTIVLASLPISHNSRSRRDSWDDRSGYAHIPRTRNPFKTISQPQGSSRAISSYLVYSALLEFFDRIRRSPASCA